METTLLREIACIYNNESVINELELIIQSKDTLKIALLGRFASGKSSLINSLFNISYMPVRDDETTSRITFIEYGDIDRALKIMNDNSIVEIPLEVFSNITTTFPKEELEKITYLKLELNNPLLKGITFIDTPGIAGINKFSKEVAYNYLPNIDFAIYTTFETGFNSDDLNFLELSKSYLTHILPIINKADLVTKEKDETFNFYEREWNNLFNVDKRHPLFFYSSDKDFDYNNKGNKELKKYLFDLISNEKEQLKEDSLKKKISKLKSELIYDLENRKNLLCLIEIDKELKLKLLKLESELSKLHLEQTDLELKVDNPIRQTNENFLNNEFDNIIFNEKQLTKEKIESLDFNSVKRDFNRILEISLKDTGEKLTCEWNLKISEKINKIIKDFGHEIDNSINILVNNQISTNLCFKIPIHELSIPEMEELTISNIDKKNQINTLMNELEKRLEEEKINIKDLIEAQKDIENELSNVKSEYNETLNQFNDIKNLDPMYREIVNDKSVSNGKFVGKIFGEVADFALIFLPGTQIKLVEPLMKVSKVINVGETVVTKAKNIEDKLNKVKDISNKIHSKLQKDKRVKNTESFKKFSNFASNFTFSTWGERLGGTIGELISPATVRRVIDPDWEEDQKRQLSILESELRSNKYQLESSVENKIAKEIEISQIKYNIDDISKKIQEYENMVMEIEKEERNKMISEAQRRENYMMQIYKVIDQTFYSFKKEIRLMFNLSSENLSINLSNRFTDQLRIQINLIKQIIQDTSNSIENSDIDRNNKILELNSNLKNLKEMS